MATDAEGWVPRSAYSAGQVTRWKLTLPPEFKSRGVFLGIGNEAKRVRPYTFWMEPQLFGLSDYELRHRAGLNEMKFLLRAADKHWDEFPELSHAASVPDGIWNTEGKRLALEYDVGYKKERVLTKGQHYQEMYDGQVWGTHSLTRAKTLRGWLPPTAVVLVAPWW